MTDLEKLKYPIGKYEPQAAPSPAQIQQWIDQIAALPALLKQAVAGLSEDQLNQSYRPGGWSKLQVIHHLADSHLNAYIRFKLAITENNPTIRPYDENLWAECEEAKHAPVAISLALLESLHKRWVMFLKTLKPADFDRSYFHPEHQKTFNLNYLLGLYAWHGAHHLAHIKLV